MKRITNNQVKIYQEDPDIMKVSYIGDFNYKTKAEMIGFNKELSAYLWLVDNSHKVLEVKQTIK